MEKLMLISIAFVNIIAAIELRKPQSDKCLENFDPIFYLKRFGEKVLLNSQIA